MSSIGSHGTPVAAFNSSTTLAESNPNDDSVRKARSDFASTSEKNGIEDPSSSAETQKNGSTTAALFDMKPVRSAIEGEGDNEPNGPKTNEVKGFTDENSAANAQFTGSMPLNNAKKEKLHREEEHLANGAKKEVLRDMQNIQYSNSKVLSYAGREKEMTEEESLRRKHLT